METNKDINPQLMQEYLKTKRFGALKIELPNEYTNSEKSIIDYRNYCSKPYSGFQSSAIKDLDATRLDSVLSINLDKLFRKAISIGTFFKPLRIKGEDIGSICIYGDVLYKSFLPEEYYKSGKPNFLEIILITKEAVIEEKHFPKSEKLINGVTRYKFLTPEFRVDEYCTSYDYIIKERSRKFKTRVVYKSVDELITQFKKKNMLSESVIMHGLPIIGQENFEKILQELGIQRERNLHTIEWSEDTKGTLCGKLE